MILNATSAAYYFYGFLFAIAFFVLFYGIVVLYKAVAQKQEDGIRKAKLLMLLAVISMICITIVSYFLTGNVPVY
jgi:hypothetical protein